MPNGTFTAEIRKAKPSEAMNGLVETMQRSPSEAVRLLGAAMAENPGRYVIPATRDRNSAGPNGGK